MEKQVEHEGTVASMVGNTMTVHIAPSSACSGCAAKGYCVPSEGNVRNIQVDGFSGDFILGERVKVIMRQSLGMRAVCFAYLVPLAVVLTTLLIAYQSTGDEFFSGMLSLLILVPYYWILKLMNRKLTKTLGFTVQKIDPA